MLRVHSHVDNEDASEALRSNGFCLVRGEDRPGSLFGYGSGFDERRLDLLEERRFALSQRTKNFMTPPPPTVRAGSRPEEGFSSSTEKEAYHFSASSRPAESFDWGLGTHWRNMKRLGESAFWGINCHVLNHNLRRIRPTDELRHAFPDDEKYERWIHAVRDSDQHVLSFFRYRSANPAELHAAAHVDKGALTVCENPNGLEVFCAPRDDGFGGNGNGRWIALGPQPPGTLVVLVGYSLERATGGIFRAARHRVRNDGGAGGRRSRVMKIRFSPNLVIYPPSVIASASPTLRDDVPDPPDSISVQELLDAFDATHESVNAPGLGGGQSSAHEAEEPNPPGEMGVFSSLPADLLYCVLDWLRDIRDSARLGCTCRSLRAIAGSEAHIMPAVDSSSISWDYALDRIGIPSTPRDVVANGWLRILGEEMARRRSALLNRVRDANGEEVHFRTRQSTKFGKLFLAYAQRKGVAVNSLRFLLDGDRLPERSTPYSVQLEDGDQIDCTLEMCGD